MTLITKAEVVGVDVDHCSKALTQKDPSVCSNWDTLFTSRFVPGELRPSDEDVEAAKESNQFVDMHLDQTTAGHFLAECTTLTGRIVLLSRVANPTADRNKIENRCKRIQALVENPELMAAVEAIVAQYAKTEETLLNQYDPKGPGTKKPGRIEEGLKLPEFEPEIMALWPQLAEKWRSSPSIITVNDAWKTCNDLITAGTAVFVGGYTTYLFATIVAGNNPDDSTTYMVAGASGGLQSLAGWIGTNKVNRFGGWFFGPARISRGVNSLRYCWAERNVKICMQHVMTKCANSIRAMHKAHALFSGHTLTPFFDYFEKLNNLIQSRYPEVQDMLNIMHSGTLSSESSRIGFFKSGPVLCGWDSLQKHPKELAQADEKSLSEINQELEKEKKIRKEIVKKQKAIMGKDVNKVTQEDVKQLFALEQELKVAKARRDNLDKRKKAITNKTPEVPRLVLDASIFIGELEADLVAAKRVLAGRGTIISNHGGHSAAFSIRNSRLLTFPSLSASSIDLPPISIITGQNGAGKTSIALNWVNNILARQSLGIAACGGDSNFPIYDRVLSSKVAKEGNNASSFEATDAFVENVKKELVSNPNKKFFLFFDELYKDTDPEKGADRLIAFEGWLQEQYKVNANFTAVFITHSKVFALSDQVKAAHYFTRKDEAGKPTGQLEPGIFAFDC